MSTAGISIIDMPHPASLLFGTHSVNGILSQLFAASQALGSQLILK
jgi:hypothetical protein